MGLDTYAVRPEQDADGLYLAADPAHFATVGVLVGGVMSGNGNDGSFRGKVYDNAIHEATGVSLYQEFIPPLVVAGMADSLDAVDPETFGADDLTALRQFFQVCRDQGYGLVGWW